MIVTYLEVREVVNVTDLPHLEVREVVNVTDPLRSEGSSECD